MLVIKNKIEFMERNKTADTAFCLDIAADTAFCLDIGA